MCICVYPDLCEADGLGRRQPVGREVPEDREGPAAATFESMGAFSCNECVISM